ncbi:MAG: hypothetical protein WB511_10240 [Nitrososphaeraceae archaeon]
MLTREEKEDLIIKLSNEGKNIREIAKEAHVNFTDIGKILKKINGEVNSIKNLDSQAFTLFSNGKKVVEVAIELDLPARKTQRMYRDYLRLIRYDKITFLYDRIEPYLPYFLEFFDKVCEKGIKPEEIKILVKYIEEIIVLDRKVINLRRDIAVLQNLKNSYNRSILMGC